MLRKLVLFDPQSHRSLPVKTKNFYTNPFGLELVRANTGMYIPIPKFKSKNGIIFPD